MAPRICTSHTKIRTHVARTQGSRPVTQGLSSASELLSGDVIIIGPSKTTAGTMTTPATGAVAAAGAGAVWGGLINFKVWFDCPHHQSIRLVCLSVLSVDRPPSIPQEARQRRAGGPLSPMHSTRSRARGRRAGSRRGLSVSWSCTRCVRVYVCMGVCVWLFWGLEWCVRGDCLISLYRT